MRNLLYIPFASNLSVPSDIPETEYYSLDRGDHRMIDNHPNFPRVVLPLGTSFGGLNEERVSIDNPSESIKRFHDHQIDLSEMETPQVFNINSNEARIGEDELYLVEKYFDDLSKHDLPESTISIWVVGDILEDSKNAIVNFLSTLPSNNHLLSKTFRINNVNYTFNKDDSSLDQSS